MECGKGRQCARVGNQDSKDNFENEDVGWKKNGCNTDRKNPMEIKILLRMQSSKMSDKISENMCKVTGLTSWEGNVPVMIVGRDVAYVNVQVDGGMIDLSTRNSG